MLDGPITVASNEFYCKVAPFTCSSVPGHREHI